MQKNLMKSIKKLSGKRVDKITIFTGHLKLMEFIYPEGKCENATTIL